MLLQEQVDLEYLLDAYGNYLYCCDRILAYVVKDLGFITTVMLQMFLNNFKALLSK